MHDVDTALLRTFASVAETRSFSRTGDLIGRSQSAVSGQIRKLEEVLGCRLLDRDTRNVRLTSEGERLLVHARAMIAAADAMLARFREGDVAGEVRFGAPEDFASAYLPGVLGDFAAAHPGVELHVTCALTLHLMEAFREGELDLLIVKGDPGRREPGAEPLWREGLVWVAGAGMPEGFGEAVERWAGRGRALPLVLAPDPCVYRNRARRALDRAHAAWTTIYTSPSFAGQAAAVRAGLGYSVMPRGMVPEGMRSLGEAEGWPGLEDAEMCLIRAPRTTPAADALARFIGERVTRRRGA